jgi:peroxiredoxin
MTRRISLRLLIFLAILFLFGRSSEGEELFLKAGIQPIKAVKNAPDFRLNRLNDKKVELKEFRGKVVLLNFWATWCGPCKEEMPSMEALYQLYKEKNFSLLAISVDYEGVKPVKEFIEKQRYTFPVLLDPDSETLDPFGVKGIPTTFVINKKGRIVGRVVGPKDWKKPEVLSVIDRLLLEK